MCVFSVEPAKLTPNSAGLNLRLVITKGDFCASSPEHCLVVCKSLYYSTL